MLDAKNFGSASPKLAGASDRKQLRSRITRTQLLDAARHVFSQDGFELARLEDIATAAGKTRGAFYDHFKDKEDVFFAIFEQDIERNEERLRERLQFAATSKERIAILADHLAILVGDQHRLLLYIEFKLYVIRKPHQWKRLSELHRAMCMRCAETHIDELIPDEEAISEERKRSRAALLGAVMDGLILNHLFDPGAITDAQTRKLISAGLEIALRD